MYLGSYNITNKKPEDCEYYTIRSYDGQGGCLGTKEIDPCEGEKCKRWKRKTQAMGRWVKAIGMLFPEFNGKHRCSNCGYFALEHRIGCEVLTPYCPWCGKPMDVEGDNGSQAD